MCTAGAATAVYIGGVIMGGIFVAVASAVFRSLADDRELERQCEERALQYRVERWAKDAAIEHLQGKKK